MVECDGTGTGDELIIVEVITSEGSRNIIGKYQLGEDADWGEISCGARS